MDYINMHFNSLPRIMFAQNSVIKNKSVTYRKNPYYEITFIESGEISLHCPPYEGARLRGGQYFFMPAGQKWSAELLTDTNRHSCAAFFLNEECRVCGEEDVAFEKYDNRVLVQNESIFVPITGNAGENPHACRTIKKVIEECRRGGHYSNLKCANLLIELLVSLASQAAEYIDLSNGSATRPSNTYYCERIDSYLLSHYRENIDMTAVAEYIDLHPNYVSNIYKRITGGTVMSRLKHIRLEEAKKLILKRRYKIKEVADLVGFEDYNYFCNVFRREEGVSPGEYARSVLEVE